MHHGYWEHLGAEERVSGSTVAQNTLPPHKLPNPLPLVFQLKVTCNPPLWWLCPYILTLPGSKPHVVGQSPRPTHLLTSEGLSQDLPCWFSSIQMSSPALPGVLPPFAHSLGMEFEDEKSMTC